MNKMNKKADIPIMVLVFGVIVLCSLALFSFFSIENRQNERINSVYALQETYNLAESFKLSSKGVGENNKGQILDLYKSSGIKESGGVFVVERQIEFLKIEYKFDFDFVSDETSRLGEWMLPS